MQLLKDRLQPDDLNQRYAKMKGVPSHRYQTHARGQSPINRCRASSFCLTLQPGGTASPGPHCTAHSAAQQGDGCACIMLTFADDKKMLSVTCRTKDAEYDG